MQRITLMIAGFLAICQGALYGQVEFICRDLPAEGVILVCPSSPDYPRLVKDVQDHIAALPDPLGRTQLAGNVRPEQQPLSAILLNNSKKPIVTIKTQWCTQYAGGQTVCMGRDVLFRDFLLPIGPVPNPQRAQFDYWRAILPGSKRFITQQGYAGVNTDVRPFRPDEAWTGILITSSGSQGGGGRSRPAIVSVTLTVDGVFFEDGEFVGPDSERLWESITDEARMRLAIAKSVSFDKAAGKSSAAIFEDIAKIIGPPPENLCNGGPNGMHPPPTNADPAEIEKETATRLACDIERPRRNQGDEVVINLLGAHAGDTPVDFRRRK